MSDNQSVLDAIKDKLTQGHILSAIADLEEYLVGAPENTQALYLLAVALRFKGEPSLALVTLDRLKRLSASHSRAYQETGHCHRDIGDQTAALQAYQRALQLNPALEGALRGQWSVLNAQRKERSALQVKLQLERLLALPKPLRSVMELMAQNKLVKAETLCRQFLLEHPRHVEGMRLLADVAVRLGVLDDAEFLLESALAFDPSNQQVHMDYVQVLRKRQKFSAALSQAKSLLASAPNNLQFRSLCAVEYMQTGAYEQALTLLDDVLVHLPNDPITLTTKGHALKTSGRGDAAVDIYRQVNLHHPEHGEAYHALANLKTYVFSDAEFEQMQVQASNPNVGYLDRVYLNFAIAKACEDKQEYALAFEHYERGNRFKKNQSRYSADRMEEEFEAIKAMCDAAFFARRAGQGAPASDPIFVLGMPRAGSTLLEQILSSHSQIDGTLELPNIISLSQKLRRSGGYPQALASLDEDRLQALGGEYIESTRIHRESAPFFVDKMPNNFRHIGLIKLILPNAKIIDARRSPMACCFSGYKQLFAEGQEFSYDLEDLGRYYRGYVDLMDHWDSVLPGFVLRVNHEDVVDDLEGQVRRVLAFCGLPFESSCVQFHKTKRNVRTPSSEQVRQPIFRDSVAQWRNFQPWLAPLERALGPLLEVSNTGTQT
ncbi:MAG: tetratricopeptide repeat protein [Gammaproteobacteria bacterium]|jgi:tetratricopeptide (TPR) repeat protein|nr:tetratricopeptide repeat protein [Gammaproteobacteria bacterium]